MSTIKKAVTGDRMIFSFVLKTGEWRKLFSELQCKTMIAEALNACVCHGSDFRLQINGYLITHKRVFLVIYIKESQLHSMFEFFYKEVRASIHQALKRARSWNMPAHENGRHVTESAYLFEKHELTDAWLVYLITGRTINLPYSDPLLDRVKKILSQERFCSVVDYTGAKSPVLVKPYHLK